MIDVAITLLAAGAVGGFLSSTPLGVINLWVADATLARPVTLPPWSFISGVIAADLIWAGLAAWGYHTFVQGSVVAHWLEIGGGLFLAVLGIGSLLKRRTPSRQSLAAVDQPPGNAKDATLGFVMCASNPAFLVFWVFALQEVEVRLGLDPGPWEAAFFVIGAGVGDAGWFRVLLWILRKTRSSVTTKPFKIARQVVAGLFVAVGIGGIVKGLARLGWLA